MPSTLTLHHYQHNAREGVILEWGEAESEIAPLPGWSKESLEEALSGLQNGHYPPSVAFGVESLFLQKRFPAKDLSVGICALNQMKPGCSALKLKIGHLDTEEAVQLISCHMGKVRLRLDVNRKYSFEKAQKVLGSFPEGSFEFVEEPLENPEQILELKKCAPHPYALDESLRDRPIHLCLRWADHFVIKPTLQGGIAFCCFLRDLAKQKGITSHLSASFESPVGLRAIKHMAITCGFPTEAMGLDAVSYDWK